MMLMWIMKTPGEASATSESKRLGRQKNPVLKRWTIMIVVATTRHEIGVDFASAAEAEFRHTFMIKKLKTSMRCQWSAAITSF